MDIKQVSLKDPDKKKLRYILIAVVLLAALVVYVSVRDVSVEGDLVRTETSQESAPADGSREGKSETASSGDSAGSADSAVEAVPEYIYVDVSGAVNSPMVVCIPYGSRVFEAIDAAGGRNEEASVKNLNLASVCEDGQKIYVPTAAEVEAAEPSGTVFQAQNGESGETGGIPAASGGAAKAENPQNSGRVNLNTAGSEELQTLPGVGPAIASRIIDYRNTNGAFQSAEDIRSVSGIGDKIYEKLKDHICV